MSEVAQGQEAGSTETGPRVGKRKSALAGAGRRSLSRWHSYGQP